MDPIHFKDLMSEHYSIRRSNTALLNAKENEFVKLVYSP